ncbi:hypothetical protein [Nitrospira moscoviensis]|uniref:hypothetical protein n=1 Tax=Nitrospira moscoviensis TaxID=42253 RepID=UPI0006A7A2B9|nr:hypothetical protein [Nitrospira moscoviensis]
MKPLLDPMKPLSKPSWVPLAGGSCRHRQPAVLRGRSRTVTDDSGMLAITAWTCAECGQVIEEIRILSRDGRSERPAIRYAVAAQDRFTLRHAVSGRH